MKPAEVKAIIDGVMPVLLSEVDKRVKQRVESLDLPKGEKGEPGEKGEKGEPGQQGKSVSHETIEKMIHDAVAAIEVEVPEPRDGRDALDIEIMPAIDSDKSYPRGTYAIHLGGLWKSFQQTHGMTGWECVVAGHHKSRMDVEGRTTRVVHIDSKGVESVEEHKYPGMIYRGVYRDGNKYEAGDVVTCGGSMFHCQKDDPEGKPGSSDDWVQCVKKGRDSRS